MTPEQAASDSEVQLTESRRWLTGTPTQWMDEEEEAELPMIVKVCVCLLARFMLRTLRSTS